MLDRLLGMLRPAVMVLGASAGACLAQTSVTVSDQAGLIAALEAATGGETILMQPGDYGNLELTQGEDGDFTFAAPVTLRPADPQTPARLTGLDLMGIGNLTFDGLLFDHVFRPGQSVSKRAFVIARAEHIVVRNSVFDGDIVTEGAAEDVGLPNGVALSFRRLTHARLENNRFFNFYRGVVMWGGRDITVRGNELSALRMDGMNFAQMTDVVIEENFFHGFVRSKAKKDHADMIQFWTNRTSVPSTNITIRNNVLLAGPGGTTQSIFMRNDRVDRGKAGKEMFYRDITIEGNVIINGHVHGITLGEGSNLVVRNNTVLRSPLFAQGDNKERQLRVPRIRVAKDSESVTITGNIVSGVTEAQPGWTVSNNMRVQDIYGARPNHYTKLFPSLINGDPLALSSYVYGPGVTGGAPRLRPDGDFSRFSTPDLR